jgi:DNA helicase-2/ATP-dependent DNA helicase PcrA
VRFYADLHIHSRYSRACSRDCDLEHLAWWAGRKGITVVGTGDFTHPAWAEELRRDLVPAEPGMFRLRPDLERDILGRLPAACRTPARFVLSSEISTIYKRDGRTRKVHHLLYAPSLSAVDEITRRLARVGNLAADGRPILGLDSRDLLEITLSGGDGCYLVPAHAWTPWFAVLGSQSGFDRVGDCYADLASHIFAIETGLSSDPEMNWRVSSLDGYRLISNSDAHSPPMLGREATVFDADLDYFAVERALRTGEGFGGTVEFFPEEGKYHLDGHRACGVRTSPEETRAAGGKCPVCGKTPTIGVQHRVEALADRAAGYRVPGAAGYRSFVPLPEILGEIAGVGAKSKSVAAQVSAMVERFGPELSILGEVPLDDLAAKAPPIVAEAIARLRRGEARREAGYDGVYGTIRLFDPGELAGAALFDLAPRKARRAASGPSGPSGSGAPLATASSSAAAPASAAASASAALDPEQEAIVTHEGGPLIVVVGPGAGKTRVLTHAIARRVDRGLPPERCLAVTFTRRARDELRDRLAAQVGDPASRIAVATFHGLGLLILREQCKRLGLDVGLKVADEPTRLAVLRQLSADGKPAALASRISAAKRAVASLDGPAAVPGAAGPGATDAPGPADVPGAADAALAARYDAALRERGLVDMDDLLTVPVTMLGGDPALAAAYQARWTDVFVDEYQDVDELQYRLLRLVTSAGSRVCVIGDPDQAIYGFRGGDVGYFLRFRSDFPAAAAVTLSRGYRSAPTITRAAMQLIRPGTLVPGRELVAARTDIPDGPVAVIAAADERDEAETVAAEIDRMLGGASFHALDSRAVDARDRSEHQLSFADFAVLYRTTAQAAAVGEALGRRGFPCQRRSHERLADMAGVPEILAALSAPTLDSAPVPVAERLSGAVRAALSPLPGGPAGPGPAGAGLAGAPGGGAEHERASARAAERERAEKIAAIRAAADVLAPLAARCGGDFDRFLDELALGAEVDTWDPRADRISLLTLHAAKGLEFPVVFIVGCDDGLLPLRPWHGATVDYAEERRLLFVGMTRATTRLVLLTAGERSIRGTMTACSPSPFLASVDPALLDHRGPGSAQARAARRGKAQRTQQATLF